MKTNDMKTDDMKTESIDNMKTRSIDNVKTNDMKTESTDNMKTESTDNMKTESTDNLKTESTDNMKTESTDNMKTESTDNMKTESTDNMKTESTDNMKTESTNDIKTVSTDNIKIELVDIVKPESIKPTKLRDIYGLYVNDKLDDECSYVHAFSYDNNVLQKFIDENSEYFDEQKDNINIKIEKVQSYNVLISVDGKELFMHDSSSLLIYSGEFDNLSGNKIYGWNKETKNKDGTWRCDQVLIVIYSQFELGTEGHNSFLEKIKKNKIFKGGISLNNIEIDTYYEESIMNA
jgi:hypothetical protein